MSIEQKSGREIIQTRFSVSVVAYTRESPEESRLLLVKDKETQKLGLVAGGLKRKPGGEIERPEEALSREWTEETGLPFTLYPRFYNALFFIDEGNTGHVGFIYHETLDDGEILAIEKGGGKNKDPKTDELVLLSVSDIIPLLLDWKKTIYKPIFNFDTMRDWLLLQARHYAIQWKSKEKILELRRKDYGVSWENPLLKPWR